MDFSEDVITQKLFLQICDWKHKWSSLCGAEVLLSGLKATNPTNEPHVNHWCGSTRKRRRRRSCSAVG